jgi:hypothetical protein
MKIVAIVHRADRPQAEFDPHLAEEAKVAMRMWAADDIRELYSRADGKGAVIVFEAGDAAAADAHMKTLPLVKAGLLTYELYPLKPYRGIAAAAG